MNILRNPKYLQIEAIYLKLLKCSEYCQSIKEITK